MVKPVITPPELFIPLKQNSSVKLPQLPLNTFAFAIAVPSSKLKTQPISSKWEVAVATNLYQTPREPVVPPIQSPSSAGVPKVVPKVNAAVVLFVAVSVVANAQVWLADAVILSTAILKLY